jgi:hypothetical protein
MRGLGLVVGYVLGNATARKWCLDNLKKASLIIDQELKKTPMGKLFCSMVPEKKNETINKEKNDDRRTD